ncbi:MAG: phytoene/squalene synthase family protein [Flavobacteriales bacterium]|nr:phytoene/squalene synthase family protein [Flavobacteriales bacterium]
MKDLYDKVSFKSSEMITKKYSTSFSLGILLLEPKIQKHIYSIYGFVRLADEIVDTFHDYPQEELLNEFVDDTKKAIRNKISLNPVLNSFQTTVNLYNIDEKLIDTFIHSMRMDLEDQHYNQELYEEYILGSAEVVGLMCLKIFVNGNDSEYERLKPFAMKLGSVFQKVNFLRDLRFDLKELNRSYFPSVTSNTLTENELDTIYAEIQEEFEYARKGVVSLPISSRMGVYLAYRYYHKLFKKIKRCNSEKIMNTRIRIPNFQKIMILFRSYVRYQLKMY